MVKCPACHGLSVGSKSCSTCSGLFLDFLTSHTLVQRQTDDSPFSHFAGSWESLELLVARFIHRATPGYRDGVLFVPVPADGFYCGVVEVATGIDLVTTFEARRKGEEPHITVTARGVSKPRAEFVEVVVYRHDVLEADKDATAETCYEITTIIGRPTEAPESLHPVMMQDMPQ